MTEFKYCSSEGCQNKLSFFFFFFFSKEVANASVQHKLVLIIFYFNDLWDWITFV